MVVRPWQRSQDSAAMARSRRPESDRRDFFLFVDEFQNFATEAFCSMLAEARKYRLTLVLSHRYTSQRAPAVPEAVFGNIGTIVSFAVGFADAEPLHAAFGKEFTPTQFVDLPRHEMLVRLPGADGGGRCQRARSFPPLQTRRGRRDRLIRRCRERFGTPRSRVEHRLHRWLARRF